MMETARQIPLEVWQNLQGDIILKVSERACQVYFGCWEDDSNPSDYIARLTFNSCLATKYVQDEFLPYKTEGERYRSSIHIVDKSKWLKERITRKNKFYPNSQRTVHDYTHFVVQGHDVYVEVIAKDYTLERLSRDQAGEFARLIDEA